MNKIIVIQDVKTKEYYCRYRADESFSMNVEDAYVAYTEQQAEYEIKNQMDWSSSLFENRVLEIKTYYKHGD